MKDKNKNTTVIGIRVTSDVKALIKKRAMINCRSMGNEILYTFIDSIKNYESEKRLSALFKSLNKATNP